MVSAITTPCISEFYRNFLPERDGGFIICHPVILRKCMSWHVEEAKKRQQESGVEHSGNLKKGNGVIPRLVETLPQARQSGGCGNRATTDKIATT